MPEGLPLECRRLSKQGLSTGLPIANKISAVTELKSSVEQLRINAWGREGVLHGKRKFWTYSVGLCGREAVYQLHVQQSSGLLTKSYCAARSGHIEVALSDCFMHS